MGLREPSRGPKNQGWLQTVSLRHDLDLMRLVLQACVAALVNVQTLRAATAELKRRVEGN